MLKLLDFIDALMHLMENDKMIYRKLIQCHHYLANRCSPQDIELILNQVRHQMVDYDFSFLSPELQHDINTVLSSCSAENKIIIDKWIRAL